MIVEMSIEVSVVTPTYNRRQFIPTLIELYKNQTFPKEKMEWIIVDDGRDKVEDLFIEAAKTIPNIRYIRLDEKLRLGAKRNMMNKEAKGNIIVAMDDDDYYPPDKVEVIVNAFKKNPAVDLSGSSEMLLYYTDNQKVYSLGPFHPNHATNGTMSWRKRYSDTHKYEEYVTKAEEKSFLEEYKHKMIQIDTKKSILVICHTDNTVDKTDLREVHMKSKNNHLFKETKYTLEDIVKEEKIRNFYLGLSTA
jgi:glycosyltransferase involved in cell wall biosynthesis